MKPKKEHTISPKKSDSKKLEASNCFARSLSLESKTKSENSKQTIRKKWYGFGDNDSL